MGLVEKEDVEGGVFCADIPEKPDIPDFARSMVFILVNLVVLDASLSSFFSVWRLIGHGMPCPYFNLFSRCFCGFRGFVI